MLFYLSMIEDPEDRSKFEVLYIKHREPMYYIAFYILENVEDAEDAVHQAFINVAENIQKVGDPDCDKTKSYLSTIVESRAIDIWRVNNKRRFVPYDDNVMGMPANYSGSDDVVECLAKLPARYREILLLKHRHGFTNAEIANMLNLTVFNVKKLYQRAKQKLKDICQEEGIR